MLDQKFDYILMTIFCTCYAEYISIDSHNLSSSLAHSFEHFSIFDLFVLALVRMMPIVALASRWRKRIYMPHAILN